VGAQTSLKPSDRAPFSLGELDLRVRNGDAKLVLLGFLATLVVALPVGYGTGFLLPPGAKGPQAVAALLSIEGVVNIAQIVLFEEILFRALLFGGLYNKLGRGPGVIASAVIFGLLHLIQFPLVMAIMATWAGVVFALQYDRTRRLSTPILTHALVIAVQYFILPT